MLVDQTSIPTRADTTSVGRRATADRWGRPPVLWEQTWRHVPDLDGSGSIVASRWCDEGTTARTEQALGSQHHYTVAVALRPMRLTLRTAGSVLFEGTMPSGTVHVSAPGKHLDAMFLSPCDFMHLHVEASYFQERQSLIAIPQAPGRDRPCLACRSEHAFLRDELTAQLCRSLTEEAGEDPCYAGSIGQAVLLRVLTRRRPVSRVSPLTRWRLRRVQNYVASNLSEPITLASLAGAAGLSKMHFAAQFRAATGCGPHDYVLQHRIEHAKNLLVNTNMPLVQVALSVGFQTQSHFSTVFKRFAGEAPGRWQRAKYLD